MSKTYNRRKLFNLVTKGLVTVLKCNRYDDGYGTRNSAPEMKAAIAPERWEDRAQGVFHIFASDFEGKPGRAWVNKDGTVTLNVHSNLSYDLRIDDAKEARKAAAPEMSEAPTCDELTAALVENFANLVALHQLRGGIERGDHPVNLRRTGTRVQWGKKFARVDVGHGDTWSGRYMVDLSTLAIYGIKGYGRVHMGRQFGTITTIGEYDWSGFSGVKLPPAVHAAALSTEWVVS